MHRSELKGILFNAAIHLKKLLRPNPATEMMNENSDNDNDKFIFTLEASVPRDRDGVTMKIYILGHQGGIVMGPTL